MNAIAVTRLDAVPDRALSAVAWAAILAGSGLGEIVWRVVLGGSGTAWVVVVQLGALLATLGLVRTWETLRPLTPLVSALVALTGSFLALLLLERGTGFTAWADRSPQYEAVPAESALLCLPTLVMVGVAFGFGLGRRQVFLARGNVHAPSRVPGTSRRVTWSRLGPLLVPLFAVPVCVQSALTAHPDWHLLTHVGELLPLGIAFAAVNAAQEELRFRAVPLALAVPVVGGERAIWMTATAFGLGHWFGHPSGPSGVALTLLGGLFLAKAILETRGLLWAWAIHAVQDVLIFAFLVLGSS
jgi:membrane protease YdiL (CAAX protease family)